MSHSSASAICVEFFRFVLCFRLILLPEPSARCFAIDARDLSAQIVVCVLFISATEPEQKEACSVAAIGLLGLAGNCHTKC